MVSRAVASSFPTYIGWIKLIAGLGKWREGEQLGTMWVNEGRLPLNVNIKLQPPTPPISIGHINYGTSDKTASTSLRREGEGSGRGSAFSPDFSCKNEIKQK